MKIQISFRYFPKGHTEIGSSIPFQITIDENNVDMSHYEGVSDLWDYWFGENDNELLTDDYIPVDEEEERVFEVLALKKYVGDKQLISGDDMEINIYENTYEDDFFETLDLYDLDIKYL